MGLRSLKEGDREQDESDQYVANAQDLLADSALAQSNLGRFTLAYEGIHCLSLAVLNHHGHRPGDGEGHRTVALQLAVDALRMSEDEPSANRVLNHLHDTRNKKIYRQPLPPVSKAVADAAVLFLRKMLPLARVVVVAAPDEQVSDDGSPTP